jgi:hypothetical protein
MTKKKELWSPLSAMLLYVSADSFSNSSSSDALWSAGAAMCGSSGKEEAAQNVLYPGDLSSLTRRPLLLVCEGSCGTNFRNFTSSFASPCIALLAPQNYPVGMERQRVISPTFILEKSNSFGKSRFIFVFNCKFFFNFFGVFQRRTIRLFWKFVYFVFDGSCDCDCASVSHLGLVVVGYKS